MLGLGHVGETDSQGWWQRGGRWRGGQGDATVELGRGKAELTEVRRRAVRVPPQCEWSAAGAGGAEPKEGSGGGITRFKMGPCVIPVL
jgi:hypothetical protein